MRTQSQPATLIGFSWPPSYGRRKITPTRADVTCLALCVHHETEKALLVSDCADQARAVWCPKSLLSIDPSVRGEFIVATISKRLAEQKNLWPRAIDTEGWIESSVIALSDAQGRAARKHNLYRNHHEPLPYPGRNAFA